MKKMINLILMLFLASGFIQSCEDDESNPQDDNRHISGAQSPMGQPGTQVTTSSVIYPGVSDVQATVTTLNGGVSNFKGSAIVTDPIIRAVAAQTFGLTISGDTLKGGNLNLKITKEGFENVDGPTPGIIVKYSSEVGDRYPIGETGNDRVVTSKSNADEYPYGFFLIKVMKVEEVNPTLDSMGINKVTYIANHRFGIVGITVNYRTALKEGVDYNFPLYWSAENQ